MQNTSSRGLGAGFASSALVFTVCCVAAPAPAQPVPLGGEFVVGSEADTTYQFVQRTRAVSRTADGSFVVVWQRAALGGRSGIFVQRYDASGSAVGTEFRVSGEEIAQRNLNSIDPAVAHTQNGEFVVVWSGVPVSDPQAGFPQIVGRRVDSDGMLLGTEFQVSVATPAYGSQGPGPDLTALGDGSFVVVWPGRPDPGQYLSQIIGQRMSAAASKIGTEFMANTFTEGYAYEPQVGTRGDGSFVVVWTATGNYPAPSPDGAGAGVFGQRFTASGNRAGTEFQVNTFTTYAEARPDLAVHSDGSFVVVWQTQYGDDETFDDSITMRRYNPAGAPIGDEVHINSYVTGAQRAPAIAMQSDGSFVVVWESHDGYYGPHDERDDGVGIFGRGFTNEGVGDPGEFHINDFTTGIERDLSIAMTGSGDFVVVWERAESLYGSADSYARLFTTGGGTTTSTTLPDGVCGDPNGGGVAATDALIVLQTAVVLNTCQLCVCDVDGSGGVAATDSLIVLQLAVGQQVPLMCPAC